MRHCFSLCLLSVLTLCVAIGQNNSLHFDGANSFAEVSSSSGLTGLSEMTVEGWFMFDSLSNNPTLLSVNSDTDPGGQQTYLMGRAAEGGQITFALWNASGTHHELISQRGTPLNRWVHLACVITGNTMQIFINGTFDTSRSFAGTMRTSTGTFRLGKWWDGDPGWYYGKVDELRISDIARYKEPFIPSTNFATDGRTIALWHFDTSLAGVVDDASGYNRHLVLTNASLIAASPLERPVISVIKDVPHDQGKRVEIRWQALSIDQDNHVLSHYSIWRAIPEGTQAEMESSAPVRYIPVSGVHVAWEWLTSLPAHKLTEYSYTAETLYDSTSESDAIHYYFISAQTTDPNIYTDSAPDSGYSVDNLSPLTPSGLLAQESGSGGSHQVALVWTPNPDNDISYYAVYRSTLPGFDPSTMTSIAKVQEERYIDSGVVAGANYYYKVSATDFAGNESGYSDEAGLLVSKIDNQKIGLPREVTLSQNYPNPFNPVTVIKYTLPVGTHVTLKVFTILGIEVITVFDEFQELGHKEVEIDGISLASGVYLYRIITGEQTLVRKMVIMK